jgi:lipoprotein-releasing system ATP-binding protein
MSDTLHLKHISKTYADTTGGPSVDVLRDISLQVEAGQSVAITGPSGCGKSTLLNIAGTLDSPTSGDVLLDGCNLATVAPNAIADIRNRDIGFIFQLHHLLPQCSVIENVLIPSLPSGCTTEIRERATTLLARVGLKDHIERRPDLLSGGERQRVAVVRALLNRPKLLLADEPTGSLDGETAERLVDLLVELNVEENIAVVLVTHSEPIASRMQRHFVLRDGRLTPAP